MTPAWLVVLALAPAPARQAATDSLVVEVAGQVTVLRAADLAALPQDTIRGRIHDGPEVAYVGPRLAAVLTRAGANLGTLRGAALAQYVVVEARDGYRVVFAVAELVEEVSGRQVILACQADGRVLGAADGPYRIIAAGESRPARWARMVSVVRLLPAAEGRRP